MPTITKKPNNVESKINNATYDFDGYQRILSDTGVSIDQLTKTVLFRKKPDFEDYLPILPSHPPQRHAVRIVTYALQVGLDQPHVKLRHLKKILAYNNYAFPGSSLGSILVDFRRSGFALAAPVNQHRNRPVSLTEEGLEMTRKYLRKA